MPITFRVCRNSFGNANIDSFGEPQCIRKGSTTTQPRYYNASGFINTVCYAYNKHLRLVLRPDDVWIAVLIRVRELYGNTQRPKIPYSEMDEKFVEAHGGKSWLLPDFTTTTYNDRLTASVLFYATPEAAKNEDFILQCGIPEITLLGTEQDWTRLKAKIFELRVPHKWLQAISPILKEFIDVFTAPPRVEFWNRICSYVGGGSSVRYLSGWITLFCTFQTLQEPIPSESVPGTFFTSAWPLIDTDRIPLGYYTVYFSDMPYKLQTGHRSVLNTGEHEIQPGVEWALIEIV